MHRFSLPLLLSLLVAGAASCASEGDSSSTCEGAKCDTLDLPESEVPASPCDGILVDKSGRRLQGKIAGRLQDPLSKLVFRAGDDCPTNFTEIMKKLNAAAEQDGVSCNNRRTMMVSETAQALGEATSYRSVTALDCTQPAGAGIVPPGFGSQPPGVLFSLFGLQAGDDLPPNVEMISFDKSSGVFNYYETNGTTINFFGNSKDLLKGAGSAGVRRCAACHTGGGLIMKELAAPWLHWEGDTTTPGASEFITAHEDLLGSHANGITMEGLVRAGNSSWSQTRLAHLKEIGDTKSLLRPLFCTMEVNLESAESSDNGASEGDASSGRLSGTIFSGRLGFGSLSFSSEQYDGVIRANGQVLEGLPADKIDTVFGLTTVVPGAEDEEFVDALIADGIIDDSIAQAVLAVDFTRSVFSDDRCGLLDSVPGIPLADLNAAGVRAALIGAFSGAAEGSPGAELFNNLQNGDAISGHVSAFSDACQARTETQTITFQKNGSSQSLEVPSMLVDYMKVVSQIRDRAREMPVFEFPQTMPSDQQGVAADTRLDPNTCTITTEFVPVASAGEPPVECCRTCGANSQACGDSCISLTSTCSQPAGCACEG